MTTPLVQLSPVFAAEAGGIRCLGQEIPCLAVNQPESLGIAMFAVLFEADLKRGIEMLLAMVLPALDSLARPREIGVTRDAD